MFPSLYIFKVMRKLFLLLVFSPILLMSQSKFGYFSYKAVLDSLPQYKISMDGYDKLKKRCLKEIDHNEQELTRFYVAFLDGQRDFPEPILRKRQKELQQLIDNSISFRDELKRWLKHAKDSLTEPSRMAVDSALPRVCEELSLSYAIDTDNGGYRYINPKFGQDITADIISVILYPERPLREVVEIAEVATDSVATDGTSALPEPETVVKATENESVVTETSTNNLTEKETSATEAEQRNDDNSAGATEETETSATEQILETVIKAETEATDSIINK